MGKGFWHHFAVLFKNWLGGADRFGLSSRWRHGLSRQFAGLVPAFPARPRNGQAETTLALSADRGREVTAHEGHFAQPSLPDAVHLQVQLRTERWADRSGACQGQDPVAAACDGNWSYSVEGVRPSGRRSARR